MPTLGENIRAAREAAGIKTQGAFAKRLGVPQPQVSDWENDRYAKVELQTVLRIASAIPCSVEVLLRGLDPVYDAVKKSYEVTSPDTTSGVQENFTLGGPRDATTTAIRLSESEIHQRLDAIVALNAAAAAVRTALDAVRGYSDPAISDHSSARPTSDPVVPRPAKRRRAR